MAGAKEASGAAGQPAAQEFVTQAQFAELGAKVDKLTEALTGMLARPSAAVPSAAPVELKVVRPSRAEEMRRAQRELDRRTASRDLDIATKEVALASGAKKYIVAVIQPKERGARLIVNPPMIVGGGAPFEVESKYREFHGITAVSQPSQWWIMLCDDPQNPVPSDVLATAQKRLSDAKRLQEESSKVVDRLKAEVA